MTKRELIAKVQKEIEPYSKQDASHAVDIIFEAMVRAMQNNERIEIRGFGNFTIRRRKPVLGRNPKTTEIIHIPGKRIPFFKVGKELNEMINR